MANEKRLIDANALWWKLETEPWYDNADRDEIALPMVDNAPTVDAVEVVRCKDCRFIIDREDGTHGCYLHFLEDCKPDDFCSYGERKDHG